MLGNITLNDSRFKYKEKGFTSIFNTVIDLSRLHYTIYGNYDVWVDDKQVLELFVNTNNFNDNAKKYNVSDTFFELFEKGKYNNTYNAHTLANEEDLKSRRIQNILKFKPEIFQQLEILQSQMFNKNKILGIQIRGTDKIKEIPKLDINQICKIIDNTILEEKGFDKLFVATDDIEYLTNLITRYGKDFVIYNKNNIISYDKTPIHFNDNKTLLNYQVVSDCYLLSKTDYFLYCFSNVSLLALSLRTNYKKIKNINTHEKNFY